MSFLINFTSLYCNQLKNKYLGFNFFANYNSPELPKIHLTSAYLLLAHDMYPSPGMHFHLHTQSYLFIAIKKVIKESLCSFFLCTKCDPIQFRLIFFVPLLSVLLLIRISQEIKSLPFPFVALLFSRLV